MRTNVERKRRNFPREGKLRQCRSFCPTVFPASIGNGDKRKVVKSAGAIFSGRQREEVGKLRQRWDERRAKRGKGIFFSERKKGRKERERERGIHFRRTRVCKDASNKIGNPTINTSEMLILPAGVSRRLPAAALGIIRDSRFVYCACFTQ